MKKINAENVFSYILSEDEWYGVTAEQREKLTVECMVDAKAEKCRYAAILVEPDAVMSVSPISRRHKVWGFTFPTDAEREFKQGLAFIVGDAIRGGLTVAQIKAIMHQYAENKLQ